MPNEHPHFYDFGPFRINLIERRLLQSNQPINLSPKAFEMLLFFIERADQIIDKDVLMREVWKDTFVEEGNITVHISTLRKIFARDSENSVSIETFPRRGYRFNGNVSRIFDDNTTSGVLFDSDTANGKNIQPEANEINQPEFLKLQSITKKEPIKPALVSEDQSYLVPANSRRNRIFLVLAVALITIIGSAYALYNSINKATSSQPLKITRVFDMGKTVQAAISPDGKYVAHAVTDAGKQSLWIKHLVTNSNLQLVEPANVFYSGLTFSNDGNYIYYVRDSELYQIAVLGGDAKKINASVDSAVSFSPNGQQFAFVRKLSDQANALMIANVDGSGERQLSTRQKPELFGTAGPAWSPGGEIIACPAIIQSDSGRLMNILSIPVEGGEEKQLSSQKWRSIDRVAWLFDGSGLIAPAVDDSGQTETHIWLFPMNNSQARQISNDLNNYGDISLTADSRDLVTIQFDQRTNIWLLPNGETGEAKLLTGNVHAIYRFIAWTPDGKIIYPSNADSGGHRDIWIMNADGSNNKQLTSNAGSNLQPCVTPDNRFVVFSSNRGPSGAFNLWRMNIDGTNPVQLTHGDGENQPNCSPDGQWVVFASGGPESVPEPRRLWKVSINGGDSIQLTQHSSNWGAVSPDGKTIACWYKSSDVSEWKIALLPIEGGEPVKLFDVTPTSPLHWSPDGKSITYVKTQNAVSNIWSQPINGGVPQQLTKFTAEQITNFDWSKDNKLICSRGFTARDAILISNFRQSLF